MKLTVERKWRKDTYTVGRLYVDGAYFCNTLEDKDRGLKQTDDLATIKRVKVYGETAIPIGTYRLSLNVVSPKYKAVAWYRSLNGGKMPRVLDVPGFDGIVIHPGNKAVDTYGCLLVGSNTVVGGLTHSRAVFSELDAMMRQSHEQITIEYVW